MNNHVVLIGRLNNDIEKNETEDKTSYKLSIKIIRNFKSQNDEYESDIIPVSLIGQVGNTAYEYCQKDDLIAIKGRIESNDNKPIRIIAERISFLSSKKIITNQN